MVPVTRSAARNTTNLRNQNLANQGNPPSYSEATRTVAVPWQTPSWQNVWRILVNVLWYMFLITILLIPQLTHLSEVAEWNQRYIPLFNETRQEAVLQARLKLHIPPGQKPYLLESRHNNQETLATVQSISALSAFQLAFCLIQPASFFLKWTPLCWTGPASRYISSDNLDIQWTAAVQDLVTNTASLGCNPHADGYSDLASRLRELDTFNLVAKLILRNDRYPRSHSEIQYHNDTLLAIYTDMGYLHERSALVVERIFKDGSAVCYPFKFHGHRLDGTHLRWHTWNNAGYTQCYRKMVQVEEGVRGLIREIDGFLEDTMQYCPRYDGVQSRSRYVGIADNPGAAAPTPEPHVVLGDAWSAIVTELTRGIRKLDKVAPPPIIDSSISNHFLHYYRSRQACESINPKVEDYSKLRPVLANRLSEIERLTKALESGALVGNSPEEKWNPSIYEGLDTLAYRSMRHCARHWDTPNS